MLASATFLLMFSASPGAQEPHNFEPRFNLFSKQQDVQLGEEAATQVRKGKVVVKDRVLTDYVNRVGKLLATSKEAESSGLPFTFEVLADPTTNAFTVPGGPLACSKLSKMKRNSPASWNTKRRG